MGRKPLAFCGFLFDVLGLAVGDELVDLFPGTGIVGRSWANLSGSSATFRRLRSREGVSSPRALPAPSDETSPMDDVDERRNGAGG